MKKTLLATLTALTLGGSALADGFSLTLNVPILPQFGLQGGEFTTPYRSYRGTALNYTLSLTDNVVAGASLRPGFVGGEFSLSSRVGLAYVTKLTRSDTGYVEVALRAGSDQVFRPGPLSVDLDLGAEIFLTERLTDLVVFYGGAGLNGNLFVIPAVNLGGSLNAYAGLKLEFTDQLEGYLEGGILYPFGARLGYDVTTSLYYTFLPGLRAGVYGGFVNQSGLAGAWKLGLAAEFTEKPETLGTPGNYLP